MRSLKVRVVLCAVLNTVCIVIVVCLGLVGVIPSPTEFTEVRFSHQTTNDMPQKVEFVNSRNSADPWDRTRTSRIEKCKKMISGVPELSPPPFVPDLKNPCWFNASGTLSCLPYYYLIGMVKCGTSDLDWHIVKHPDIVTGSKGDMFWFRRRFENKDGNLHLRSMQLHLKTFANRSTTILASARQGYRNKVFGDSTAGTLYNNKFWRKFRENCNLEEPKYTTADYIHYLVPKARIVAILRNPTDRAYSSYLFFPRVGPRPAKSPDDFHEQVVIAIERFENCLIMSTTRSCAYNVLDIHRTSQVKITIGLYYVYIEDYMKVFSPQQVMVIRFEDYIKDRLSAVKSIYTFLDLRPLTEDEENTFLEDDQIIQSNSEVKKDNGPMRNDTRKLLDNFYSQYNRRLANLLGDDRYTW